MSDNLQTSYTYLGWERRVQVNLPSASSMFTLIDPNGVNGPGGDKYVGLDRFNRISELRWLRPGVELERVQYGFDWAGNRQWHDSLVATPEQKGAQLGRAELVGCSPFAQDFLHRRDRLRPNKRLRNPLKKGVRLNMRKLLRHAILSTSQSSQTALI